VTQYVGLAVQVMNVEFGSMDGAHWIMWVL
jgi:hypothetical protein